MLCIDFCRPWKVPAAFGLTQLNSPKLHHTIALETVVWLPMPARPNTFTSLFRLRALTNPHATRKSRSFHSFCKTRLCSFRVGQSKLLQASTWKLVWTWTAGAAVFSWGLLHKKRHGEVPSPGRRLFPSAFPPFAIGGGSARFGAGGAGAGAQRGRQTDMMTDGLAVTGGGGLRTRIRWAALRSARRRGLGGEGGSIGQGGGVARGEGGGRGGSLCCRCLALPALLIPSGEESQSQRRGTPLSSLGSKLPQREHARPGAPPGFVSACPRLFALLGRPVSVSSRVTCVQWHPNSSASAFCLRSSSA